MSLDLLLFVADEESAMRAHVYGVDGVIIDLEARGKADRQSAFDTQISVSMLGDVARLRPHTRLPMVVRINSVSASTGDELDAVIAAGADEVLVPMVRRESEIDAVLDHAGGRIAVSCMVETEGALAVIDRLASRPIQRYYIGLNDLRIEQGRPSIFHALVDGTVDRVVTELSPVPTGVAGLTHPRGGTPIPCDLLLDELVRLGAAFTFLRRSFYADLARWDGAAMVRAIRKAVAESSKRSAGERAQRHDVLAELVAGLAPVEAARP